LALAALALLVFGAYDSYPVFFTDRGTSLFALLTVPTKLPESKNNAALGLPQRCRQAKGLPLS